jgi:HD-GYP domain-containing protein (c-di-GMP phosphodiesterase class II)
VRRDEVDDEYLRHRNGVAELTKRLIQCRNPSAGENEIFSWFMAGFLHDIGKQIIDRQHPGLLEKAAPLTDEDWDIIRTHTVIGYERLKESGVKEIADAAPAALEHHERWDGSGYMGKKALGISLPGRVVAIADVYDALCHDRSYRKAWSKEAALDYMSRNSGILFDPEWIEALMKIERNGGNC